MNKIETWIWTGIGMIVFGVAFSFIHPAWLISVILGLFLCWTMTRES